MNCPECKNAIKEAAQVCEHCGQRITGKQCPDCAEFSKEKALVCRHCSFRFEKNVPVADFEPLHVIGDRAGTFFKLGRFRPQEIDLSPEKIVITSARIFGLIIAVEEVPWEKIAGFNHLSGLFWDSVRLETRGQTANAIHALKKDDSKRIVEILKLMKP